MSALLDERAPESVEEKRAMLLKRGVALWDVIASCRIDGASDASIRDVVPNDLGRVFREAPIERVFTNGGTAHKLYLRHQRDLTGVSDTFLPSTSAANARYSLETLIGIWGEALFGREIY